MFIALRVVVILVSIACSGCVVGSQSHLRMLESDNNLNIEISSNPAYDYVVKIRNSLDIGYNPDQLEDRNKVALSAMKQQCPNGQIVGEDTIKGGRNILGNPAITYLVHIKCN